MYLKNLTYKLFFIILKNVVRFGSSFETPITRFVGQNDIMT